MRNIKLANIIILLLLTMTICYGQVEQEEKEIIIVEKVVDEDGNVISVKTKRYNGSYTEDDIQNFIEEDGAPSIRSYDLDGLGYGDLPSVFGQKPSRPTIGVNLSFDGGKAIVAKVSMGSGAEQADIRVGDQLISLNDVAISTIEDISEVLDGKKSGDKVRLTIFRDGEEIEKNVSLGSGGANNFFFDFPKNRTLRFFEEGGMMDMDSLLRGFMDSEEMFRGFNFGELGETFGNGDKPKFENEERPSLGVFLDDIEGGVQVSEVIKDSPAMLAGIEEGDIIERLDDNIVTSFREVSAHMNTKSKGDSLTLEINRRGRPIELVANL